MVGASRPESLLVFMADQSPTANLIIELTDWAKKEYMRLGEAGRT